MSVTLINNHFLVFILYCDTVLIETLKHSCGLKIDNTFFSLGFYVQNKQLRIKIV